MDRDAINASPVISEDRKTFVRRVDSMLIIIRSCVIYVNDFFLRCECHGHGNVCDPVTGEKCNCGNNTESDATCQTSSLSKNSAQECWRYQCVKCRDSFMGDPKNGHQCYRMMTADNKMCFDGKLMGNLYFDIFRT
jgi:hypothetical protein